LKKCRFFAVFFLPDFCLRIQSYHDHLGYSPIKNGFSSDMFSFGISGQSSSSHFRSRGYPRLTMSRFMALSDHGIFRVQKCWAFWKRLAPRSMLHAVDSPTLAWQFFCFCPALAAFASFSSFSSLAVFSDALPHNRRNPQSFSWGPRRSSSVTQSLGSGIVCPRISYHLWQ
jgi:hypothetical protein